MDFPNNWQPIRLSEPKKLPNCECDHAEWQHWSTSNDEYKLRRCSNIGCACEQYEPIEVTPPNPEEEPREPLNAVNRIRIMGGYFGLTKQQTDDLAEDLEEWLAKKIGKKAPQEPACPMTVGNWTVEEWRAAEARVFAKRVLYNPDSLSAIYKDIAINLQAELTRNASIIVAKDKALADLIKSLEA